jgi:ubiquinone/menaquinone biosynthesis C-methylase UbiE
MPEALYDTVIADFYDASPLVATRTQDRDFYLSAARNFGSPILELGCGTGRIAAPLAQAGNRVTGLDISEKMLERAAQKRAALNPVEQQRLRLIQGDMTNFDLQEYFPLIIVPFRPFQHLLNIPEQLACLACARRHLERNGRLILDFFQTDAARMHDPDFLKEHAIAEYEMSGGRRVRLTERTTAFHRAVQCNDVEMTFEVTAPGGEKTRNTFAFTIRYFFRYEVEHLLARAGFRVLELFGDFNGSPLRDDSPEMIFVAGAV